MVPVARTGGMPAAVWIAAAMVFARIALIRGAQALDGIVIVA